MRKRALLVAGALLLTIGCAKAQQEELALWESSDSSEKNILQSEDFQPDQLEELPPLSGRAAYAAGIIEDKFFRAVDIESLEKLGITVEVRNIWLSGADVEEHDNWNPYEESEEGGTKEFPFQAELVLSSSSQTKNYKIQGTWFERTGNIENLRPIWGGISILDGYISLNTLQKAEFIAIDTLEDMPVQLDFSVFSAKSFTFNDVGYHQGLGYILTMYVESEHVIAFFDDNGKYISQNPIVRNGDFDLDLRPWEYLPYVGSFEVLELDVPVLKFVDRGFSDTNITIMRTDKFEATRYRAGISRWDEDGEQLHYQQGDKRVEVYFTEAPPDIPVFAGGNYGVLALHYENNDLVNYVQLPVEYINYSFGRSEEYDWTSDYETQMQLDETQRRFTMYTPIAGQRLVLDFQAGTGMMEFVIREQDVQNVLASAPGGQYQLVMTNLSGMGDAYWGYVALQNMQTGTLEYVVATNSGNIIEVVKFLDDKTILYKPSPTNITFISCPELENTRQVELRFPDREKFRVDFNSAYDPATDRFYVAYIDDVEYDGGWEDFTVTTFRIAEFDGSGSYLRDMATDLQGNNGQLYTRHCPEMEIDSNVLIIDGVSVSLKE